MPYTALAFLVLVPNTPLRQEAPPGPDAGAQPFTAVPAAFEGSLAPTRARAFDVLSADLDLDGDPDLLLNWHHEEPLELFENQGGRFVRLDPELLGETGLDDAPGIASLFGEEPTTRERARASAAPGLFVWHDPVRQPTRWHLAWHPDPRAARLVLELNRDLTRLEGLEEGRVLLREGGRLEVDLAGSGPLEFSVETPLVATRVELRLVPVAGSGTGGVIHAGRGLRRLSDHAAFWKPDPHGAAWLDLEGSPHPELFVCRGGLRGELAPPLAPKQDRWFTHTGGSPPYRLARPGIVPPDHARARAVEAVDLEADGRLELSISARGGPGRLLARRGAGPDLVDLTAELDLDGQAAEVRAWLDHDGDGLDDLLLLEPPRLTLLRNEGGRRLVPVEGATIGLVLPRPGRSVELFERAWLRPVDLDQDGDLDLLVLAYGRQRRTLAFLREGDRFVDATAALGLEEARSYETAVVFDADRDGRPDLLTLGAVQRLWRAREDGRFEPEVVPLEDREGPVVAATTCDADGDGRTDVVVVADRPVLLRNTSGDGNGWLDVRPRSEGGEPVGALVVARHRSGRASARRFGSEHSTAFSQALQPVRFGVPADDPIVAVDVRWPGTTEMVRTAVPEGIRALVLRRP
jgi:hypothetical protein